MDSFDSGPLFEINKKLYNEMTSWIPLIELKTERDIITVEQPSLMIKVSEDEIR